MAEYQTGKQVNYGFGLSFEATGKAPIIAKQIWATLEDAQAYVNSSTDTACKGLILTVINDATASNNGVYLVTQAAGEGDAVTGILKKLSSLTDIPDVNALIQAALKELDSEKSGSADGTTVKVTETDGKISAVAVSHTKGAIAAGDTKLVDGATVKTYVDTAINAAVGTSFKVKGCKDNYSDLPTTGNAVGDVWNIKNEFTIAGEGKYPAGSNVVWVAEHEDGSTTHTAHWDVLGGTYDLSVYKTKQDAVEVTGSKAKTVTKISQDANGKITATTADIEIGVTQVTSLETTLDNFTTEIGKKANSSTTVNGKALTSNVTLTGEDIAVNSNAGAKLVSKAISDLESLANNTATQAILKDNINEVTNVTELHYAGNASEQAGVGVLKLSDEAGNSTVISPVKLRTEDASSGSSTNISGDTIELIHGSAADLPITIQVNDLGNLVLSAPEDYPHDIKLQGVADPEADDEVANKHYVDIQLSGLDKGVISLGNGTVSKTGNVQIVSASTSDVRDHGYLRFIEDTTSANSYRILAPATVTKFFMKDYEAATASAAVAQSDDMATAIGKLEYRIKQNEDTLTWGTWE